MHATGGSDYSDKLAAQSGSVGATCSYEAVKTSCSGRIERKMCRESDAERQNIACGQFRRGSRLVVAFCVYNTLFDYYSATLRLLLDSRLLAQRLSERMFGYRVWRNENYLCGEVESRSSER